MSKKVNNNVVYSLMATEALSLMERNPNLTTEELALKLKEIDDKNDLRIINQYFSKSTKTNKKVA